MKDINYILRALKGSLFIADDIIMENLKKGNQTVSNGHSSGYKLNYTEYIENKDSNYRYLEKYVVEGNTIHFSGLMSNCVSFDLYLYSDGSFEEISFQDYYMKEEKRVKYKTARMKFNEDQNVTAIETDIVMNSANDIRTKIFLSPEEYVIIQKANGTVLLALYIEGEYVPTKEVRISKEKINNEYGYSFEDAQELLSYFRTLDDEEVKKIYKNYENKYSFRPLSQMEKDDMQRYVDMVIKLPEQIIARIKNQIDVILNLAAHKEGYNIKRKIDVDNYVVVPGFNENLKQTDTSKIKLLKRQKTK